MATKSILKQDKLPKKSPGLSEEQKSQVEKDRQNLNIALKHAHLIQYRKDVETAILNAMIHLVDFPESNPFSTKDALTYLNLLKAFQPSDFDDLIQERRINRKCGYGLCPNQPRSLALGESAAWKLKKGMGDWCSDRCARKGLYLKAQLIPVPAWEREANEQPDIQLHEDDRNPEIDSATSRANTYRAKQVQIKRANNEELAKERGDQPNSFRPNQVMADTIIEKETKPFKPFMAEAQPGHHGTIEGYQPKHYGKHTSANSEDDSDDAD